LTENNSNNIDNTTDTKNQSTSAGKLTWSEAFMASPGPKTWLAAILLFVKGLCMGVADIIPGVSGGTIAFITGIYENLIKAIASFDWQFIKDLLCLRWRVGLSRVHLRFIVLTFSGVSIAIFSSASMMHYLMDNFPVLTWSAFFGLIAGSIVVVYWEVKKWTVLRVILLIIGAIAAWLICGLIPVQTPTDLWFIFVCGVIGICAMILPGLSGSFLLLILGKYYYITGALKLVIASAKSALHFEFAEAYRLLADTGAFWALVFFQLGQLSGIVGFSRFLKWLLAKCHEGTMCVLAGLMIGAMRKIWPWKHALEQTMQKVEEVKTVDGVEKTELVDKIKTLADQIVLPWDYGKEFTVKVHQIKDGIDTAIVEKTVSGLNPHIGTAIAIMVVSFIIIMVLERLANKPEEEKTVA